MCIFCILNLINAFLITLLATVRITASMDMSSYHCNLTLRVGWQPVMVPNHSVSHSSFRYNMLQAYIYRFKWRLHWLNSEPVWSILSNILCPMLYFCYFFTSFFLRYFCYWRKYISIHSLAYTGQAARNACRNQQTGSTTKYPLKRNQGDYQFSMLQETKDSFHTSSSRTTSFPRTPQKHPNTTNAHFNITLNNKFEAISSVSKTKPHHDLYKLTYFKLRSELFKPLMNKVRVVQTYTTLIQK